MAATVSAVSPQKVGECCFHQRANQLNASRERGMRGRNTEEEGELTEERKLLYFAAVNRRVRGTGFCFPAFISDDKNHFIFHAFLLSLRRPAD